MSNKFQFILQFEVDTDLDKRLHTAKTYNKLLRDLPINQLLSATNLQMIVVAIENIFN
jgi:hypothetical protein